MEEALRNMERNAAQLNDIHDTSTTNALIVAVAHLREEAERLGAIRKEGELRSLVETGELDRW